MKKLTAVPLLLFIMDTASAQNNQFRQPQSYYQPRMQAPQMRASPAATQRAVDQAGALGGLAGGAAGAITTNPVGGFVAGAVGSQMGAAGARGMVQNELYQRSYAPPAYGTQTTTPYRLTPPR